MWWLPKCPAPAVVKNFQHTLDILQIIVQGGPFRFMFWNMEKIEESIVADDQVDFPSDLQPSGQIGEDAGIVLLQVGWQQYTCLACEQSADGTMISFG